MATGNRWTKDELRLAFNLYCQLPFGRLHSKNPEIIELAKLIRRTPSSVAMKLVNFASLEGCVFLRDGADRGFVRQQPRENIWTFIVSDEGRQPVWLISDGFHYVNAMGYLVTRRPREDTRFYDIRY